MHHTGDESFVENHKKVEKVLIFSRACDIMVYECGILSAYITISYISRISRNLSNIGQKRHTCEVTGGKIPSPCTRPLTKGGPARENRNERAFIIAALAILTCVICLSTVLIILFMNLKGDGTIGVITTTGNVRVDIVDTEKDESLVGKVLAFQENGEDVDVVFYPGSTYGTQGFRIKNTGGLAVKFHLSVSKDEKIDMEEFLRAFDVWISTDPNGGGATVLTEYTGTIEVGGYSEDTYYLFISMKESAGNEFQGKTYTGIGFTVYAVQYNAD